MEIIQSVNQSDPIKRRPLFHNFLELALSGFVQVLIEPDEGLKIVYNFVLGFTAKIS
jgi:hypothetical protein